MLRPAPAWLRPVVDYGPLVAFLLTYFLVGIMPATAVLIGASLLAAAAAWAMERRVPVMALVTAGIVAVFGGLTLWLQDENFLKLKPTILYLLFALLLGGGLVRNHLLLPRVLGKALTLSPVGWRILTIRFTLFFVAMAVANEVIRHVLSTKGWVLWTFPGSVVLTFLFFIAQAPLLKQHGLDEDGSSSP